MTLPARTTEGSDKPKAVGIAGEQALCDHRGVLFFPEHGLLAVSDLHLEKGAAFARRGQFLPPYDTAETLERLGALIGGYDPRIVVSLGDSFHDRAGAGELPETFRDTLRAMMRGRDWIWITGNHDPDAPKDLPGESWGELQLNKITFRHEPAAALGEGEVAGHLHPCARIVARGRSVRRRCFATDGARMVLPAFGAFTGSLNVLAPAYAGLFEWETFRAYMMGSARVFPMPKEALRRD